MAELTSKEILQQVRALIAEGFAKGAFARNAAGESVHPVEETAVCWCTLGALRRVARDEAAPDNYLLYPESTPVTKAIVASIAESCAEAPCTHEISRYIAMFNDRQTKEEVLAMLQRAEELLTTEDSDA